MCLIKRFWFLCSSNGSSFSSHDSQIKIFGFITKSLQRPIAWQWAKVLNYVPLYDLQILLYFCDFQYKRNIPLGNTFSFLSLRNILLYFCDFQYKRNIPLGNTFSFLSLLNILLYFCDFQYKRNIPLGNTFSFLSLRNILYEQ